MADCTGHGVPGAFMSVLAISSLEKIVKHQGVKGPSEILQHLNDDLYNLLKPSNGDIKKNKSVSIKDGLDIVIVNVDVTRKKVLFAGSRNSMIRISNDEIIEIKYTVDDIGLTVLPGTFTLSASKQLIPEPSFAPQSKVAVMSPYTWVKWMIKAY